MKLVGRPTAHALLHSEVLTFLVLFAEVLTFLNTVNSPGGGDVTTVVVNVV